MSDPTAFAERAKRNGGRSPDGDGGLRERVRSLGAIAGLGRGVGRASAEATRAGQGVVAGIVGQVAGEVQRRLTADLDDRDPDHLREQLPLLWLLASLWFRGEVR